MENHQRYIKAQFEKVEGNPSEYFAVLQIQKLGNKTNWIDLDDSQIEDIKKILLRGHAKGV